MTRVARLRAAGCLALWVLFAADLRADRADEVKKQKAEGQATAKKAGFDGLTSVETDDLLVFAAVPEAKAKPLAEALQKTYELSRTTLKFSADDKPWPGKLTVFVLTDAAQFTNYVRLVEQRRPEKGVTYTMNLRGDAPTVVSSVDPGGRVTDAELTADAAALIGAALVNKKAGTGAEVPEWLEFGFGRAMAVRADGNVSRLANHKAKVRAAVLGTKAKPSAVRVADVWSGQKTKESTLVATSLVEYLAFGPDADKFPKLLAAFKPSDERPMPSVWTALTELEWKPDALEVAWKQWVAKQK